MRVGLGAAAEDQQALGVLAREVADGERGDRGGADVGQRDAVDQRFRGERGAVEDDDDALDARVAADRDQLDRDVAADLGGHQDQLAVLELDEAARRVGFGVEAVFERGLERVDRDDRGQVARDVLGGEIGEVHEPLTVEYKTRSSVLGGMLSALRGFGRRHRILVAVAGVGLTTGLLVYALNGRRHEFATAVSEASWWVLAVTVLLHIDRACSRARRPGT